MNDMTMKRYQKVLYTTAAIAAMSIFIYAVRRTNTKNRIAQVAEEGYETAADVLHPNTNKRFRKLHYGPVLPFHELK